MDNVIIQTDSHKTKALVDLLSVFDVHYEKLQTKEAINDVGNNNYNEVFLTKLWSYFLGDTIQ